MKKMEFVTKLDLDKLNCREKAITLLAMSTGMSIDTIMSLKARNFLEGIRGTYNELEGQYVKTQEELDNYINSFGSCCVWELEDENGNSYTTISGPEVNDAIMVYLQYKLFKTGVINQDGPLFDMDMYLGGG